MTAVLLFAALLAPRARANQITFSSTGTNSLGNPISASAVFDTSTAGVLQVVLTNTYGTQIHAGGADVLTGLYFNVSPGVTLTPYSATLTSGSTMLPGTANASNIPTEWAYFAAPTGVSGVPTGDLAIGSTGLVAGTNTDFTGTYHGSSGYLGGPGYGVLGNVDDVYGGFSPLEATSVTFKLNYTGSITSVDGVAFLYGTSSGEGFIKVPDGGTTVALLGLALLGLAAFRYLWARP